MYHVSCIMHHASCIVYDLVHRSSRILFDSVPRFTPFPPSSCPILCPQELENKQTGMEHGDMEQTGMEHGDMEALEMQREQLRAERSEIQDKIDCQKKKLQILKKKKDRYDACVQGGDGQCLASRQVATWPCVTSLSYWSFCVASRVFNALRQI